MHPAKKVHGLAELKRHTKKNVVMLVPRIDTLERVVGAGLVQSYDDVQGRTHLFSFTKAELEKMEDLRFYGTDENPTHMNIKNAPAENRTRGPTMATLDFTTKPLAHMIAS